MKIINFNKIIIFGLIYLSKHYHGTILYHINNLEDFQNKFKIRQKIPLKRTAFYFLMKVLQVARGKKAETNG